MKNILIRFIKNKNKCRHKNALLYSDVGYCPECGELLEKKYYIVRCSCCKIKRSAKLYWGEIVPQDKFCSNCGNTDFYIEKIDKINFIDAQYAVYLKEIVSETNILHPNTQIWVEQTPENIKQITLRKAD